MQVIFDSAALKPALTELAKIAPSKPGGLPVLTSVRIEVLETHVLLVAQDLETGLAYNAERRFGSTLGTTLAPAAKLLKLVAAGSGDVIITAPDCDGETPPTKEVTSKETVIDTDKITTREEMPTMEELPTKYIDVTKTVPVDEWSIDVTCQPFKAALQVLPHWDYPDGGHLSSVLHNGFEGATYQETYYEDVVDTVNITSRKAFPTVASLPTFRVQKSRTVPFTHANTLVFTHAELKGILKRVKFAMAKAEIRYYLNGLCFDFGYHQRGAIVATDGHRLAAEFIYREDAPCFEPHEELSVGYILPENAINHLYRLLSTSVEEKVTAKFHECVAEFDFGDGSRLVTKCIDGRFPDYHSVIPHRTESTVTCSTAALAKLVKAIAPFANEKYKGITLTIEGDLLTLSTKNPEGDKVTVDMPCTRSGEVTDYEIGFNLTYLLDVLSVIVTKEVDLNFNDPNSSCLITPHDVESTQYVIMPMRL